MDLTSTGYHLNWSVVLEDKKGIRSSQGAMTGKHIVVWGGLLLGILVIGYLASPELTLIAGQSAGLVTSEQIQGDVKVGQTFTAPYPGLYRIAVMMSNFGRINTHEVVFHLRRGREDQEDIYAIRRNAGEVKDKEWHSFSFPPISDSAGKTYYFFLESPSSIPGNAIAVMGEEGDPYPDGAAYVNDVPAPGDMAFKTYYGASWQERLEFLLARLAENKPSLWGDRRFYVGLAFIYLVLVIIFFRMLIEGWDG